MATTMGELPAEAWAAVYARTSRVEFMRRSAPYRREMWAFLGLTVVILAMVSFVVPDDSDVWLLMVLVGLVAFGRAVWAGTQTVGERLLLLVDANGIRYADTRLNWNQIGAIGIPHRKTLAIIPTDTKGRPLTIRHWAVRDMSALAGWLEQVLQQHRAASQGGSDHG
ncbi:hypothetical protein ACI2LF_24680 [Kribbella sp. NPDC020789]